jgi:peptidoglycan/LPS O-acetylase OafA/YrhL
MEMTAHKAIAALLTSFVAIAAMFGVSTGWATPGLLEAVAAIGGAVLTAAVTYIVPNKPKA